MKVLAGTSNESKINNIREFFEGTNVEIVTLKELGIDINVYEVGKNQVENARIKALAYYKESGLPTISYDSGLYFCNLAKDDERQPGLFVRRVRGAELTDEEMIEYYSSIAKEFGGKILCSYYTGFCVVKDNDHIYEYMDDDNTAKAGAFYLVDKPHKKRNIGWPLDSISIDIFTGKYFVEDESEIFINEKQKLREYRRKRIKEFYYKSLGICK